MIDVIKHRYDAKTLKIGYQDFLLLTTKRGEKKASRKNYNVTNGVVWLRHRT